MLDLAADGIARPTSSDVPGWAEWALTMTGQPAASADAVSPPATENASGKLLAPKTPTGLTLESAIYAAKELEETAKLFLLLRDVPARPLDASQIAELKSTFNLDV